MMALQVSLYQKVKVVQVSLYQKVEVVKVRLDRKVRFILPNYEVNDYITRCVQKL